MTTTLCVIVANGTVHAQRAMSQYVRDEWTGDRGFPGGPVHAVTQTTDGYLWIGAEKGVVRFDGLTFRLLEPRGAAPDAGPTVLGVVASPDGSLWARLRGVALLRYQNEVFENILPALGPPESVVSVMVPGRDNSILMATVGRGALTYRDGRFDRIVDGNALPSSSFVISMAQTPNGEFWLGTRGAGVVRVQGTRVTRLTDELPDLKVNCLLAMNDGEVWIGTDKGIVRWTGTEIDASGVPNLLTGLQALAMIRDRTGNIWIAAGSGGLVRVDERGHASQLASDGSTGRNVSSVFEDRDGNVWVGTNRGIERWRDPMFTTFSTAQGLPTAAIGPVYVDDGGRAWFAPTSGGLLWVEGGAVGRITEAGLDRDVVYSIAGAGSDVWLGRQRGGVTRLRRSPGGLSASSITQAEGLPQNSVYAVTLARDGALWAGTLSAGASRIVNGVVTTFNVASGLASNTVASIVESSDGTVWFATPSGLSAFSRGSWRTYTTRDGLPANDINTLFEDRHGVLWIGTTDGLAVVDNGQVRACRAVPAFLRGSIVGVAEDRSGSLWVNTIDRVLRIEREPLLRGEAADHQVREYGVADGLLAVESMKRHRTLVADSRGRIWLTLNRAISVADPGRTDAHTLPALTHVESMTADGAPVGLRHAIDDAIEIPPGRRRVAFAYTGLSLSVPERVRYRYRLDGFDHDWSEATADRHAAYTNLSHGHYRFRVIASNSDGLWNGSEASLPFEIRPMLWQTRWFQAAATVVCIAVAGGWYRLRLRQLAKQLNVRFDERLAERTRIARELHDTLLQGFISASMQLHVATDRLPDDSPAKPAFARALDLMQRVIEEGRNAVRGLRSSGSEPHELEQAFAGIQSELATEHTAAYRVIVEGTPRRLNPAVRDDVYRIGREGLVNAFRHSGATAVEIEIEYTPGELRLFVRDDGRGIDPQVVRAGTSGHWGIAGMKERAERIGGSLTIRSRAAAGTEIELRVPGPAAFERDSSEARRPKWIPRIVRQRSRVDAAPRADGPEQHP
jgi:signal transduction histidine kinase/ligand-binding sensor domain-containing protein